jgi:hypothetical protein
MSRSEVRTLIPGEVRAFKKVPEAATLTDAFREHGIHVHYDANDQCVAVDIMQGEPMLHGHPLLHQKMAGIVEWLAVLDPDLKVDADGAISQILGVALYTNAGNSETDDVVEAATAFKPGYY